MPVAPPFRIVSRDDDEVADAFADLLVAAGAEVRLAGLERMDAPDIDVLCGYLGISAHSTRAIVIANAAATRT